MLPSSTAESKILTGSDQSGEVIIHDSACDGHHHQSAPINLRKLSVNLPSVRMLAMLLSATVLAACGSDSDSDPVETSMLEGMWGLACYKDTELPAELGDVYRKVEVSFTGDNTGNYTSVYSAHNSADCTDTAIADDSGTLRGGHLLGSESMSEDGLTVTDLDIVTESVTFLDGTVVSPVVDQPLVLTIANIDGDTLYLGDNEDPDAEPPVRSTRIDFNRPFDKR